MLIREFRDWIAGAAPCRRKSGAMSAATVHRSCEVLEVRVVPACPTPGHYFEARAPNEQFADTLDVFSPEEGTARSGVYTHHEMSFSFAFQVKIKCKRNKTIITADTNGIVLKVEVATSEHAIHMRGYIKDKREGLKFNVDEQMQWQGPLSPAPVG